MSPVWVRFCWSSALARPKSVTQTVPAGVEQEVRRLDVAVEDALLVGVLQGVGHLHADPGHALPVGRPLALGSHPARPRRARQRRPTRTSRDGSDAGEPVAARAPSVASPGGRRRPVGRRRRSSGRPASSPGIGRRRTGRSAASGRRRPPRRRGRGPPVRPAAAVAGVGSPGRSRFSSSSTSSRPRPWMNCMT